MKALDAGVRIQLKNVLFCTDLSSAAEYALPYAVGFARHFGAKLTALHVRLVDAYAFIPDAGGPVAILSDAQVREQMQSTLEPFVGIEREVVLEKGDVWPTVASAIEKNQTDLIVLGTRGRTGIAKLWLGSVAEEIVRRSPCAVLTVGPHSSTLPSRTGEISEILYATDFSPEAADAASYAISLAQEYQAQLTLLHVLPEPQVGDLVTSEQVADSAQRRLHTLLPKDVELWCEPHFVVGQGSPGETILEVANHKRADLIILGVRRRRGIGAATHLPVATAHKVVSNATCPVLTVRS